MGYKSDTGKEQWGKTILSIPFMGYYISSISRMEIVLLLLSIPFMGYIIKFKGKSFHIPNFQFPLWDTRFQEIVMKETYYGTFNSLYGIPVKDWTIACSHTVLSIPFM